MCWVQLGDFFFLNETAPTGISPLSLVDALRIVSLCVIVGLPPQLSVALAVPLLATLVDSLRCGCASAGQLIAGPVASTELMCWVQLAELLQLSVAVQMRSTPAWPVQVAVALSLS